MQSTRRDVPVSDLGAKLAATARQSIESQAQTSLFSALKKGPLKVTILGAGNWASAVATLVCPNAAESYIFNSTVRMWVYDEPIGDRMLSEIMNTDHENVKYLPNIKLPENLVAVPDVVESVQDADLLIFVLPHQFVEKVCSQIAKVVKVTAKGISLVKGLHVQNGIPRVFTDLIQQQLGIDCCSLSGANVANDIARKEFSETTIGYTDLGIAAVWQQLFDAPYFRVSCLPDVKGIQVCGALKNAVAVAAGFCDGLKLGTNAKSAIIRIGVEEIKLFAGLMFDNCLEDTFFESAGFADVITTCFGGRNVKCAAEFVRRGGSEGKCSWEEVEADLLGGQKMQGQLTTKELYEVIDLHSMHDLFPLLVATYQVAFEGRDASLVYKKFMSHDSRPIKESKDCHEIVVPKRYVETRKAFKEFERADSQTSLIRLSSNSEDVKRIDK